MFLNIPLPPIPNIPTENQVQVSAQGGSSASVSVVNVVNSNSSSGGTQTIHIETNFDGQVYTEDHTKEIVSDAQGIEYIYSTSTRVGSSTTAAHVYTSMRSQATSTPLAHSTTTAVVAKTFVTKVPDMPTVSFRGLGWTLINTFSNFFGSVFGIIKFGK